MMIKASLMVGMTLTACTGSYVAATELNLGNPFEIFMQYNNSTNNTTNITNNSSDNFTNNSTSNLTDFIENSSMNLINNSTENDSGSYSEPNYNNS